MCIFNVSTLEKGIFYIHYSVPLVDLFLFKNLD